MFLRDKKQYCAGFAILVEFHFSKCYYSRVYLYYRHKL